MSGEPRDLVVVLARARREKTGRTRVRPRRPTRKYADEIARAQVQPRCTHSSRVDADPVSCSQCLGVVARRDEPADLETILDRIANSFKWGRTDDASTATDDAIAPLLDLVVVGTT